MSGTVTIRINILTHFLIVIVLIAASLLGFQYYFSKQLALSAAHTSFTQTAQKITQHIQARDTLTKNMLYLTELYPDLTRTPTDKRHSNTIKRFTLNMQRSANIYAMYIGHPNGDLFEVINMNISQHIHKYFKAPENTRWTIVKIFTSPAGRVKQFEYLDKDFHILSNRSEQTDYRANKRPWFIQAAQSDEAIRTDSYLFNSLQQNGITFAKKINGSEAVLAIDFTQKKLNELLNQSMVDPSSELVLFGRDGKIIASSTGPEPDESLRPINLPAVVLQTSPPANKIVGKFMFDESVNTFLMQLIEERKTERIIQFKDQSEDKFAMITTLSREQNADTHLGITINASVMLNPYHKQILYSLVIAFIFLLFTIPPILYMTSRIIKPIKALMVQNRKIKDRRYDEVTPIDSNITEMLDLSQSLVTMSQSIQSYQKAQQELMDSFIRLIADAIDAKSPYTGGHCKRVPEIAIMLAKSVSASDAEAFKQFKLEGDDAWREFEIGAWLHDCGKVTTPEYVVDKSTKLETIYNRIHEIRTRFEVIWRDIEIEYYQRLIQQHSSQDHSPQNLSPDKLAIWKQKAQQALQDDFIFIAEANIGGEFMSNDKKERIHSIAQRTWKRYFNNRIGLSEAELLNYQDVEEQTLPTVEQLLSDRPEQLIERVNFDQEAYQQQGFKLNVPEYLYNYGEVYNLCIEKGTLTGEERFKIQEHVIMTIKMLNTLPYPEEMQQIPEYAGTHHETMNGTGYPRQLNRDELSIPARIMAIADIFEALTASDRPYKKGKTLSEAIRIMGFMKKDQHIDGDLFELFLTSGIYKEYAEKYLKPEQIDIG